MSTYDSLYCSSCKLNDINNSYFPFPDHNSEQARIARLPYQANEAGQKLPLKQVAKITLMFCFLVSEQMKDCCKLNVTTDSNIK